MNGACFRHSLAVRAGATSTTLGKFVQERLEAGRRKTGAVHGLLQDAVGQQIAEACLNHGLGQFQGIAFLNGFQFVRVDVDVLAQCRAPGCRNSKTVAVRRQAGNESPSISSSFVSTV